MICSFSACSQRVHVWLVAVSIKIAKRNSEKEIRQNFRYND